MPDQISNVIIQLLHLKPPCLMDICFEAIHLTSCKYPLDRALGITFFNRLNHYNIIYMRWPWKPG